MKFKWNVFTPGHIDTNTGERVDCELDIYWCSITENHEEEPLADLLNWLESQGWEVYQINHTPEGTYTTGIYDPNEQHRRRATEEVHCTPGRTEVVVRTALNGDEHVVGPIRKYRSGILPIGDSKDGGQK